MPLSPDPAAQAPTFGTGSRPNDVKKAKVTRVTEKKAPKKSSVVPRTSVDRSAVATAGTSPHPATAAAVAAAAPAATTKPRSLSSTTSNAKEPSSAKKTTVTRKKSALRSLPSIAASPLPPSSSEATPRKQGDGGVRDVSAARTTDGVHVTRNAVADTPEPQRRSMPPEDNVNSSDDGLDTASDASSSSSDSIGGAHVRHRHSRQSVGASRHIEEQLTSLAGKRHHKVIMDPHASNSNTTTSNGTFGVLSNGPSGLLATATMAPSYSYAATNPRGNVGGSGNGSGGVSGYGMYNNAVPRRTPIGGANPTSTTSNNHSSSDSTLRYRTDLDKQVIHFMFERYQQEQTHPTVTTSRTGAAAAVGGSARMSPALSSAALGNSAEEEGKDRRGAAALATATSTAPQRTRRIGVEEIYVPPNSDGDDKHIGLGDWHFFWMHVGRVRHTICASDFRWQEQQIINHFPDHAELTRKDLMYRNMKRYLRENQSHNYAKLTLHTATDWVSAAANASAGGHPTGSPVFPSTRAVPFAFGAAAVPVEGGGRSSTALLSVKSYCFADGVPLTYNIPNDMSMFKEECQKRRGTQWIVKPTSRSQGKGIFIIDDIRALQRWVRERKEAENSSLAFLATGPLSRAAWAVPPGASSAPFPPSPPPARTPNTASATSATEASNAAGGSSPSSPVSPIPSLGGNANTNTSNVNGSPTTAPPAGHTSSAIAGCGSGNLGAYIVSRYISNPLLIGGKKFDLRLYVLVTSYKPLVAYLHEDGFARFCATRYNASSLAQADLGSHLTNVALQKGDEHYNTTHGGKWSFQNLFFYVQSRYGAYAAEGMMKNIQFLIYHSLKAVEPVMFNDKHSFELYGYDILIDDQINPHLIEVNASPSMSTTTISDRLLKEQVLTDTMKILFPPGFPVSNKGMPYWEYRLRTDLTTQQHTGFKLLQF